MGSLFLVLQASNSGPQQDKTTRLAVVFLPDQVPAQHDLFRYSKEAKTRKTDVRQGGTKFQTQILSYAQRKILILVFLVCCVRVHIQKHWHIHFFRVEFTVDVIGAVTRLAVRAFLGLSLLFDVRTNNDLIAGLQVTEVSSHTLLSCGVEVDVNGTVTLPGPYFMFAAGHNRFGVAETPLPAKTQGRNMDHSPSA